MQFIQVGDKFVNLSLVAWAEGNAEELILHFAVPMGTPVAHSTLVLKDDDARKVSTFLVQNRADKGKTLGDATRAAMKG